MNANFKANINFKQKYRKYIDSAIKKIMPSWPLDKSIAVNPWFSQTSHHLYDVLNKVSTLSDASLVLDANKFTELNQNHQSNNSLQLKKVSTIVHLVDKQLSSDAFNWAETITNNLSSECALFYSTTDKKIASDNLYQSWLEHTKVDYSLKFIAKNKALTTVFSMLPKDPIDLISFVLDDFVLNEQIIADYLYMLLLGINGWASYTAYKKWSAELNKERYFNDIESLLACRLAWEYILYQLYYEHNFLAQVNTELANLDDILAYNKSYFDGAKLNHQALEQHYQAQLLPKLKSQFNATVSDTTKPIAQTVFCIDVRSERIRRAIETVEPKIETKGFAGFFGLPISYQPEKLAEDFKLLPALLPSAYVVTDKGENPKYTDKQIRLKQIKSTAFNNISSMFSSVEMVGAAYGIELYKDFIKKLSAKDPYANIHPVKFHINKSTKDKVLLDNQVEICKQILQGMFLTNHFAPYVFIIGHGAECANNPHKASLNCGACGGQSGELNAQLLADLLNNSAIREGLAKQQIDIPKSTIFIAALHNTTTDHISLPMIDKLPSYIAADIDKFKTIFSQAQKRVQTERLHYFSERQEDINPATFYIEKSNLPSQVRPEWGLVNNAAFIIGPRQYTKNINLDGRVFMHDYCNQLDSDGAILNAIMTAPMVVASWINMQYFASTVDNDFYGAGSKILHNVVGGNIGVIEGSGGDLRIGLPIQSVHDGTKYMHDCLRLHVMIYAQKEKIDKVLLNNPSIKNLFDNEWLYLFQCDPKNSSIYYYKNDCWMLSE